MPTQDSCDRSLHAWSFSSFWRDAAFAFANGTTLQSVYPTPQPVLLTLDDSTTQYVLGTLQGTSTYIHQKLMESLPCPAKAAKVIRLADEASRPRDRRRALQVADDLEYSTRELIAYTIRARPGVATLLCCVQALLKAEIALAFGDASQHIGDAAVYSRRVRQVNILSRWCWSLWEQAPWMLPNNVDAEQSWLFAESMRRTLLIAHLFCDVFAVVFTGAFKFSGFVSTLPYDQRTWLWDEPDGPGGELRAGKLGESKLQSFRQLVLKFEQGDVKPGAMNGFEQLLLVACRGYCNVYRRLDLLEHPTLTHESKGLHMIDLPGLDFAPFQ